MKHIIDDEIVLSRPPEGPLAAQIPAFAQMGARAGIRAVFAVSARAARGVFQSLAETAGRRAAARLVPIMPRGICVIALDECRLAEVMRAALRHLLEFLRVRA